MKKSSKSRLTAKQAEQFPGETLFDRIARAVCMAGTLPAKELFEAWEVARRVRRKYRGRRVVDMACGHGLLGHIMLLLDDSSDHALCVDAELPTNAQKLSNAIVTVWPRLHGRVRYLQSRIQNVEISSQDLVLCVHGCGTLTDDVLGRAMDAGAAVAVLPCCHDLARSATDGLEGWVDGPLAVDIVRAERLRAAGYIVLTRTIPQEITPKNRLLMGHK